MEVTEEMIVKLARLSRLSFDEQEKEKIRKDLQEMIGFVEKLNELDLDGVEPLVHMSEEVNFFREDQVSGSISRGEALRNAPAEDGVFFKVPKVIRK